MKHQTDLTVEYQSGLMFAMAKFLIRGAEITVDRINPNQARARVAGRSFTIAGPDDAKVAEIAWQAANPKPSPARLEAAELAEQRGEAVCEHCGGAGGWRGWPGFTCHECNGRRTVSV